MYVYIVFPRWRTCDCVLINQSQPTSHRTSHYTTSQNRTSYLALYPCPADNLFGTGPTGQTSDRTKIEFWNEICKSTFRYGKTTGHTSPGSVLRFGSYAVVDKTQHIINGGVRVYLKTAPDAPPKHSIVIAPAARLPSA